MIKWVWWLCPRLLFRRHDRTLEPVDTGNVVARLGTLAAQQERETRRVIITPERDIYDRWGHSNT